MYYYERLQDKWNELGDAREEALERGDKERAEWLESQMRKIFNILNRFE